MVKYFMAAGVVAATLGAVSLPALAQDGREAQLIGFHQLCDHGDKGACVKFGMMLQQNKDQHEQWRHTHPEFFFFEH